MKRVSLKNTKGGDTLRDCKEASEHNSMERALDALTWDGERTFQQREALELLLRTFAKEARRRRLQLSVRSFDEDLAWV